MRDVGFVAGWAMNRACLSRQDAFDGNTEPDYTSVMYETHADMVQGLLKKEVSGGGTLVTPLPIGCPVVGCTVIG